MLQVSFLTTLILIALEVICRSQFSSTTSTTWLSYLYSILFSLGFWLTIALIISAIPKFLKYVAVIIIGILFPLLLFSNFVIYQEFGEYVSAFMLMFIQKDPHYLIDYAQKYAFSVIGLAYWVATAIVIKIWHPNKFDLVDRYSRGTLFRLSLFTVIFSLVIFNQLKKQTVGQSKLADGAFFVALDTAVKGNKTRGLRSSVRKKVSPVARSPKNPHIFLFIGESWAKRNFSFYSRDTDRLPHLTNFINENYDRSLVFDRAFTNSSATDVSVPSLLSGVGPEESDVKLHDMPLLWDWAKASGYKTVFISPQRLAFAHIDHFLLTPGPDLFIPGDAIGGMVINDNGIDDITAAKKLADILEKNKTEQALFVVYFSNALHFPFQTSSDHLTEVPKLPSRYENALYVMDKEIKIILEKYKSLNLEDNTLFWFTADHGEVEKNSRQVPRVSSFYQEILSIPFLVVWPKSDFRAECFSNMLSLLNTNVQNLDIVPTIADLLNLHSQNSNRQNIVQLRGRSLCGQISNDRNIIHLNTNNTRQWNPEGFAITKGDERYFFTNVEGTKYVNFINDPEMTTNKFAEISPLFLQQVYSVVKREPELNRLKKNYKNLLLELPEKKEEVQKDGIDKTIEGH